MANIEEIEGALETKNDERIEKVNRAKAAEIEVRGMEDEKDIAVEFIKKERDYMILTNMLYFVELGDAVGKYNKIVSKLAGLREKLREKKEETKKKFEENQQLVTEIQQFHQQIEQADKKIKECQTEFQTLEKSDVMIQNEKKHKLTEISKLKDNQHQIKKSREKMLDESLLIEK